jgi:hypothetical protein
MIYYKGLFFQVAKVGRDSGNVKKNGAIKKNAIPVMVLNIKDQKSPIEKVEIIHIYLSLQEYSENEQFKVRQ